MTTLFFSYSHKDEGLRDELEVHLAMLKHQGLIDTWHDRRITAGDVFSSSIDERLETANVMLLLVSPDFLASDYCYNLEMKKAMERHERGECRVIPIILRPCDWHTAPFGKLLAAPTDGKAVTKWPDRDEAFLDVVKQIRAALPKVAVASSQPQAASASGEVQTTSPRSSNLRLRKEFTEVDRDRFQDEAFEYISRFFKESLAELQIRNPGIETRFRPVDARAFGAVIYKQGNAVAQCGIRNEGGRSSFKNITFCYDETAPRDTWHESVSVESDEQSLFLKPMGMQMAYRGERSEHLTPDGAAELFWEMLIEPLQRSY